MFCNRLTFYVRPDGESGHTDLTSHKIYTDDAKPIKFPPGRLPIYQRYTAECEIKSMLQKGGIKPSNFFWASPIVLVKEKDGSTTFCDDYRSLNSVSIEDAHSLLRVDESFRSLASAKSDSDYRQVVMQTEDRLRQPLLVMKGYINFWQYHWQN